MQAKNHTIILSLLLSIFSLVQTEAKTFLITPQTDWVRQVDSLPIGFEQRVFNALYLNAKAGDTIAIAAGTRAPIKFENLKGDSLHPIVICNWKGNVCITKPVDGFYGLAFSGSRYIKLQGISHRKKTFGIKIEHLPKGNAISFNEFSSNIEICGLEISHIESSGISIKTDVNCKYMDRFFKFVLYDVKIHDNYIRNVGNEGIYLGNSFYNNGFGLNLNCPPSLDTMIVLPHEIIGVNIYNNQIDSTGWDAIQVASSLQVKITHNKISYDSYAAAPNQMAGIIIGQPSEAEVSFNTIYHSYGNAIQCFGIGTHIHHNLIVNPAMAARLRGVYLQDGKLVASAPSYGIYLNDKVYIQGVLPMLPLWVQYNTIIIGEVYPLENSNKDWMPQGINAMQLNFLKDNKISENKVYFLFDPNKQVPKHVAANINSLLFNNSFILVSGNAKFKKIIKRNQQTYAFPKLR